MSDAGSGVDASTAVLLGLASALVLAALHLLAPRIRRLPFVPEEATASFAGGVAVAYVFLHLLPELAEGNRELAEVLADEDERTALLGLEIFAVALVGFLLFYGLERLAERSKQPTDASPTPSNSRYRRATRAGTGSGEAFAVHLGAFAVYNAIIAYTLPLDWQTSIPFALLFTVAMGLHFVLSDRGLEEHYGRRFDRWPPRLLLAAALLTGWALAALLAPTSTVVVSLLTAFLAGSVLLNVFKEEIPSTRRSHFGWFTVGLVSYAVLLGLVTASAPEGPADEEAASVTSPWPAPRGST